MFISFDHNHIRFPKHTHAPFSAAKCFFVLFLYWFCIDFASQMRNHISNEQGEKLYQGPEFCRQSVSISIRPRYLHRWVTAQGEVQYTNPSLTHWFLSRVSHESVFQHQWFIQLLAISSGTQLQTLTDDFTARFSSIEGRSDIRHPIALRKLDIKLKALTSDSLNTCWRPMKWVLRPQTQQQRKSF